MAEEIRIVIADDHAFIRDGVRGALVNQSSIALVAEASDGVLALDQVRAFKPNMAILDIGLPKMDGVTVVRTIREERIPVEIIFLTIANDGAIFEQALELDVKGYLLKDSTDSTELLRCINAVSSGHHYASPALTTYLVQKTRRVDRFAETMPGLRLLTPQERLILRRIAEDKTSKEIADELRISPKTVESHRLNICRKLKLHGQHVLSRFAARHRLEI